MNIKLFKTAIFTVSLLFATMVFGQQSANNKPNLNDFLQNKQKIKVVNGSVFASFADQKVTLQETVSQLNRLLKLDENHTFEQISQRDDEIGFTHTNFQEMYQGYPVDGHIIMLHEKDGLLTSISGSVAAVKNVDIKIDVSDSQAFEIAKAHLRVTNVFKETTVKTVFTKNPKDDKFYLTKKVRVESFFPLVRYDVFVDAATGEIVKKISLLHNADVQGTAQTLFKGTQPITCDSRPNGGYRLYDNARKIGTYDGATWNAQSWPSQSLIYTNSTTTWTNNPALDVHWGMEKTYDYYLSAFNRNSYDGHGGEIYNVYNPVALDGSNNGYPTQASSWGYGLMVYGRGNTNYGYNPLVAIDVAGHEFTHMVVDENGSGGLEYYGESGALNESFADIFGTCIEFYANINPNWTIGEDVVVNGYMRSMSNPNLRSQPDTYYGNYWANTNDNYDNGGVHINSGVQNFWFYLLCQGGSGTNDLGNSYSVSAIGRTDAQRITYRNLMYHLAPNSGFVASYNGSLQAAADLFGNPSTQYTAVKNAWYAVGIDENTVAPVGCSDYLTDASGTFSDGSGNEDYANRLTCEWIISPPCATSVTLSFSEFNTESGYDEVSIHAVNNAGNIGNPLATYSGTSLPSPVTSNTGVMYVVFKSDQYVTGAGFTAHYTSTGSGNTCQSSTFLSTASGTFSDGSGNSNYCNSADCWWYITPPNATSITLNFSEFATEADYDFVRVYNGSNVLMGEFSGNPNPRPSVTVSGSVMIVNFKSDVAINAAGWTANYTSSTTPSGLEDVEESSIAIFPNPASSVANITFAENQQNSVIEIYDMVGRLVERYSYQNIDANSVQPLNIEHLQNGIYNIKITSGNKMTNHKLIVSK